jgi:hypothetical protein
MIRLPKNSLGARHTVPPIVGVAITDRHDLSKEFGPIDLGVPQTILQRDALEDMLHSLVCALDRSLDTGSSWVPSNNDTVGVT